MTQQDKDKLKPLIIKKPELKKLIADLNQYLDMEQRDHYRPETFLNDIIYFIGISIDDKKFRCANGYDMFKKLLIQALVDG